MYPSGLCPGGLTAYLFQSNLLSIFFLILAAHTDISIYTQIKNLLSGIKKAAAISRGCKFVVNIRVGFRVVSFSLGNSVFLLGNGMERNARGHREYLL